jgi:hypothetical protein
VPSQDFDSNVQIGLNAFIYYDNRRDWRELPPLDNWTPCETRDGNGHYLARVPATTAAAAEEAAEIVRGIPQGIRFFEYASPTDDAHTVAQLAWLAWHTDGIREATGNATAEPAGALLRYLADNGLADLRRWEQANAIVANSARNSTATICPLCLNPIKATDLMTRLEQVEGREVVDLTVTEANLFHLRDLLPGEYNHRPYQVAWGHHHCNSVARDHGVAFTIQWMREVLANHDSRQNTS